MATDLPETAVGMERVKKRARDIINEESRRSLQAALSATKGDPKAQEWIMEHRDLWRNP